MYPDLTALSASRVRVLSDLHLGHDVCTISRIAELKPLIDGAEIVLFNGDTYEAKAPRFAAKGREMLEELRALCDGCGARAIFLNGNHDPTCWERDWVDLGDVFVTHGHVLLRLVSPWSSQLKFCREKLEDVWREYGATESLDMDTRYEITRRCCELMKISETRQAGKSMGARLSLLLREIWPPHRPLAIIRTWMDLPNLGFDFLQRFRPVSRVLLFGHTHRSRVWRRGPNWMVNTGGFVSLSSPTLADYSAGEVLVRRIDKRNQAFHPAQEIVRISTALPGEA